MEQMLPASKALGDRRFCETSDLISRISRTMFVYRRGHSPEDAAGMSLRRGTWRGDLGADYVAA